MNLKESLNQWCSDHKITIYDAISLAFLPHITLRRLFDGTKSIAPKYRLHVLTELEAFRLNDEEAVEYEALKAGKGSVANDEKIARKFIDAWKKDKVFPEPKYRLAFSSSSYKNKEELSLKILKELFSEPVQEITSVVAPVQTELNLPNKVISPAESPDRMEDYQLESLIGTLEFIALGTKDEVEQFVRNNKKKMSALYGVLRLLLDDLPYEAVEQIRKYKNQFKSPSSKSNRQ